MQNSRDSSVWRTLAVAFGDGLAFGVGVTLTRSAARLAATRSGTPEPPPRNTPLNHRAADAIMRAIDGQFTEIGGRIDRRLAELEGQIRTELDELDAQDHELAEGVESRIDGLRDEIAQAMAAQRQGIETDMRGLRVQMTAVHKEFAETLARLVDEQISKTIDARLEAVTENLRGTIREEARLSLAPAAPPEPPPQLPQSPPMVEPATDAGLPGFARTRPRKPLWRPPIVSSFLMATGGLLLLHYL